VYCRLQLIFCLFWSRGQILQQVDANIIDDLSFWPLLPQIHPIHPPCCLWNSDVTSIVIARDVIGLAFVFYNPVVSQLNGVLLISILDPWDSNMLHIKSVFATNLYKKASSIELIF
jgi:hypothetical protein